MSKNIIIQNNGVDVTYTNIKKLKTRKSTGGTLYWLPEGEQPTGTITITENGTYTAEDANLYAFSQAIVNVQGTPTHVSGKGQDGNEYDITIDPDTGEIVQTEVPSSIRIENLPVVLEYYDGDTINFTGLVVGAYDGNGNRMYDVPYEELVFPVTTARTSGSGKSSKADLYQRDIKWSNYGVAYRHYGDEKERLWAEISSAECKIALFSRMGDAFDYLITSKQMSSTYEMDGEIHNPQLTYVYNNKGVSYTFGTKSVYPSAKPYHFEPDYNAFRDKANKEIMAWIMEYGDIESDAKIPVQWNRTGDSKMLSDSFEISVTPVESGNAH